MKGIPSPDALANLVSSITRTMYGFSFRVGAPGHGEGLRWKTAVLTVLGPEPLNVALSSDEEGCTALGAAMFGCPAARVDASMIDDSLRELLNMTAGQLKRHLGLTEASLGLPRIVDEQSLHALSRSALCRVTLSADALGLALSIATPPSAEPE